MIAEQLKRLAATGLGLAWLTKEKAESLVQELVKQGEISRDEGKELLDSLMRRAQAEKDELQRRMDAEIRRLIQAAGVASQEDLRRLEERVRKLEERLERMGTLPPGDGEPAPGEREQQGDGHGVGELPPQP